MTENQIKLLGVLRANVGNLNNIKKERFAIHDIDEIKAVMDVLDQLIDGLLNVDKFKEEFGKYKKKTPSSKPYFDAAFLILDNKIMDEKGIFDSMNHSVDIINN